MKRFIPLLALLVSGCFDESVPVDVDAIVVSVQPGATVHDGKTVVRLPDGTERTIPGLVGRPGDLFILTIQQEAK